MSRRKNHSLNWRDVPALVNAVGVTWKILVWMRDWWTG